MDVAMKRVQEEVERMERAPAPPAPVMVDVAIEARPDDERARIADNAEFMEAVHEEEESDEEDAALDGKLEDWKLSWRKSAVAGGNSPAGKYAGRGST
nr:unnamed protein product [Haemonchus contortus]